MNIFKKISLYFKVSKKFRPYFSDEEKHLAVFETIDDSVSPEIAEIYKRISELPPKKYKKDKALYEIHLERIKKHNSEVEKIKALIESWEMKRVLDDPHSLDATYLNDCLNAAELLKKYKKKDEEALTFQQEAQNVCNEIEEICRQYDLHKEYLGLFDFEKGSYINLQKKREVASRSNEIVRSILEKKKIYYIFDKHDKLDLIVKEANDKYFEENLDNKLFDKINGHSLDDEQRKAILTDEQSVLVVAGAGSGKTLTICGKVEYLLNECGVNPENILLLSYSKKSADDLQTKVSKIDGRLTAGTFHKIGLDILKETQNTMFMVEDQYKAIIEKYFREEMKKRPHMLETVLTYYGLYISTSKHDKKYINEGDLYIDLKKMSFNTLKDQLIFLTNDINARETIKKELVKSYEEMAIANWYFINGIKYTYEAPYEHDVSTRDKRQYMPDFKLDDYPVYHEHYGVDKNGEASQFAGFESEEYIRGMQWKRQLHQNYKTDCIETYSYEFDNGTVFEKLEKELKKRGVKFHPLTVDEIAEALDSIYESRTFRSFISLISSFLSLYKSSYRDDSTFETLKKSSFKNIYERNRTALFLDIVKDLYHYYMDYLKKEGKIDFDDMILWSMEELDKTSHYKYQFIIVDEFQDISISRMKFLKRLINRGNSKLFAVGDDWQAIYRFSGCDLNIFLEFPKYFGDTAIAKITTTHRNSQELQDIAGPFIKKNPEQFNKSINSDSHLQYPVRVMFYNDKKYYAFLDVLNEIAKKNRAASVLILGRNNKDFEDIALDKKIFIDQNASDETTKVVRCVAFPEMKLTFSTVHGSKGLEDDYVILINADDNRIGFPNKMEDDELLNLILSSKSEYEYAEERRLWYVALTRTRSYTYIIASSVSPSIFLDEIIDQCLILNSGDETNDRRIEVACPRCKTGRLVLRTVERDGTSFFGCSNYPYCTYHIDDEAAVLRNKRCRCCGDIMILRNSRLGSFYGCHNYPRCEYKEDVNK